MPILTLKEAKEILDWTDTEEYDETLVALLPIVQNNVIFNILKNPFLNSKVYYQNSTISFSASQNQIQDSESKFISDGYMTSEIDVLVTGSLYNDGIYYVKTAEAGALTVDFSHSVRNGFKDESAGEYIKVQHMMIEDQLDLKLATARMIFYLMQQDGIKGVKSESVLTYSVTYLNQVPADITEMFHKIRKLGW